MDGQYVLLNISNPLNDIFFKDYHVTWDPAHRLSIKDCSSKPDERQTFIEFTCNTIQNIMTFLSYGKPYMVILNHSHLSHLFLTPKIFKSMKFIGHCFSVIKSFDSNSNSIVLTLGSLMDQKQCIHLKG